MIIFQLLLASTILIFSDTVAGQSTYYTGDIHQDSLMKSFDARLKQAAVKTRRGKQHFSADSIVYYAVDKQTNQLVSIGFTQISSDSRIMYDLINGDLVRVRYIPNHSKDNPSTIYYFDKGKVIYRRERNIDTPPGEKFIKDILFFKKVLGTL